MLEHRYGTVFGKLMGIVQLICDGIHETRYGRWIIVEEHKMTCLSEPMPSDIEFS